jgi:23S rRNA (guanosine2251-2'-O)-methyltransferase
VGITPIVGKSSAGAVEYVKVARVSNIAETMKLLKKRGIWIAGLDSDGGASHTNCDLTGRIALVIGGEGRGLGRLVRETCDFTVSITMKGNIASLNASVAAGVIMYEVLRQRKGV